jgi:hypothetical protein
MDARDLVKKEFQGIWVHKKRKLILPLGLPADSVSSITCISSGGSISSG